MTHYNPSNNCRGYHVKLVVDKKGLNRPSRGGAMGDQVELVTTNCKSLMLRH